MSDPRVVQAQGVIQAPAEKIFGLIADPSKQPEWDGNDNLTKAEPGQRVTAVGDVFTMELTKGSFRENHVVEFAENELIAWKPSEVGQPQPGHLWRWELAVLDGDRTEVVHTYDWTQLTDPQRLERARRTTTTMLEGSIARLKQLVEEY